MATSKIKMCNSRGLKHMMIWNNIWWFEMELVCLKKSYLYSFRCIDPFLHSNAICYFFDIIDGHGFYSIVLWLSWRVNAACFSLTWLIPYWFYIIACADGCFIFDHCSHILVSWRFIQEWTWSALIWKKRLLKRWMEFQDQSWSLPYFCGTPCEDYCACVWFQKMKWDQWYIINSKRCVQI
jgi:hypothetical protein